MRYLITFCALILSVVIVWAKHTDFGSGNALVDENGEEVDINELCKLIKDNITPSQLSARRQFVWKTIRSRNAIDFRKMVLGTFEQNTANPYMVHTFFGRLYFSKDYQLMAKALPYDSVKFFVTVDLKTQENHDFNPNYRLKVNDRENVLDHHEILTNPYNVPYKWIKGNGKTVPSNTVICSVEFGKNYYCGRMQVLDKGLFPAKIYDGVAYAHYYIVRTSTEFEYLVYAY